jgi:hypothetical protein
MAACSVALRTVFDLFSRGIRPCAAVLAGDVASVVEDGVGAPPFFCPILRDGEFTLAQTPAIMEFLGRKHGCAPSATAILRRLFQSALTMSDSS